MNIEVNYLAILLAAVASMAIGFAWYSKAILGGPWMKLKGFTSESLKAAQKDMGKYYAVSFVVALITAYVLTHVLALSKNFYNYSDLMTGVSSAFWMWLGFIIPVQVADVKFGDNLPTGKAGKWSLLAIDTGYQLASVLAMGVVIGLL